MPAIALGTAALSGSRCKRIVEFALRSGYRAVDTAIMYKNHEAVGEAMKASGVPRSEVFVTSKVPPNMMGFELAEKAIQLMLDQMQLEFVDLCLVHWPGQDGSRPDAYQMVERAGTWRALERAHRRGLCRHLGVSNFMPQHLEELLDYAVVPPVVNQIEYHPYQVDAATAKTCRKYGIAVQAYGSMGTPGLREEPLLHRIAVESRRSITQVLLRWSVQEGMMVLPRSSKEERVLQNAQLWDFSLTAWQQAAISALHRGHRSYDNPHESPVGVFQKRRLWHQWRLRNQSRH